MNHTLLHSHLAGRPLPGRRAQSGLSLMMALIGLVAMSLTAMAMIRSVDIGNSIAGNLAFRQSTLQTTDVGTEAAFVAVASTITNLEASWSSDGS